MSKPIFVGKIRKIFQNVILKFLASMLSVKYLIVFFRAALGGHAYICQTLIKYGVDPNIQDYSGYVCYKSYCWTQDSELSCYFVTLAQKKSVTPLKYIRSH